MLQESRAAWQPRCVVGSWGGGRWAGNIISSLLPKQKENCAFSLFQKNTFKKTSWRKWKQTFPLEMFDREMNVRQSVGKWVSRIFRMSSNLAVQANSIAFSGLPLMMSLGTDQSFPRAALDPADWGLVGNEDQWLSRASQVSGNYLWGLLTSSDIKGIRN